MVGNLQVPGLWLVPLPAMMPDPQQQLLTGTTTHSGITWIVKHVSVTQLKTEYRALIKSFPPFNFFLLIQEQYFLTNIYEIDPKRLSKGSYNTVKVLIYLS